MISKYPFIVIPICLFIIACTGTKGEENEALTIEEIKVIEANKPAAVKAMPVVLQNFNQELFANGKLLAKKANLRFEANGIIERVYIREGMRVTSGQTLAVLNQEQQERDLLQANLKHKQASLDYQDQLLRAGYQLKDTAALDPEILAIARLRSGLSGAELDLQRIHVGKEQAVLKAPFAGKIANLKAAAHNAANSFDYICTLIDDSQLEVEFQVMEQELDFVRSSRAISLQPFSGQGQAVSGRITSINPLVDQSGMVTVKAVLPNTGGELMDGMSVRVIIEKNIPGQLVIPREAVLDRQGRKVVFTLEDGHAKWNYVEIAFENSEQFALKDGLKAGDQVIYEGNFNLAHDKPVLETN